MNCSHNIYEVDDGFRGTAYQIADYLKISHAMVYAAEQKGTRTKGHHIKLAKDGRNIGTRYEIYEGDEKIFVGTEKEISEKFCVGPTTIRGVNLRNSKTGKAKLLCRYTVKKLQEDE